MIPESLLIAIAMKPTIAFLAGFLLAGFLSLPFTPAKDVPRFNPPVEPAADWSARISDTGADEDDIAAADARLSEFLAGYASHVSEEDLEIGSPAIVARAFEKLD